MDLDASSIPHNIRVVKDSIEEACNECGRDISDIAICAVSKTKPLNFVESAVSSGITEIGENYVQEISTKFPRDIKRKYNLRMIGHLQTNKVKTVLSYVDSIDSVDSLHLLEKIDKEVNLINKKISVLFEINSSFDKNKTGFIDYDDIKRSIDFVCLHNSIKLDGFMTMGPVDAQDSATSKAFEYFITIVSRIKQEYKELKADILSFGMSDDYKIAIKYGSNMIRIGRAIFGERKYN